MTHTALICGERSGAFRDAFRARGWNAFSCDLDPSDAGAPHMLMDWRQAIPLRRWNLIIIHFVCTALSVSGNHVYAFGKPKHHERLAQAKSVEQDWELVLDHCDHAVAENPVGVIPTLTTLGRPSQIIQPWQFGHDASKATGLWLHNLPRLKPTDYIDGRQVEWPRGAGEYVLRWSNQTDSGQNRLTPDRPGQEGKRAKERAKTYAGIAMAGAAQWGAFVEQLARQRGRAA
jgi:hypothetical protein